MLVKFRPGVVIITELYPYTFSDPEDDLMFFLMPYGVDKQDNKHFYKGQLITEYEDLHFSDEIHMCYDTDIYLSRISRLQIVEALKHHSLV
jgi:hypothetical protein